MASESPKRREIDLLIDRTHLEWLHAPPGPWKDTLERRLEAFRKFGRERVAWKRAGKDALPPTGPGAG